MDPLTHRMDALYEQFGDMIVSALNADNPVRVMDSMAEHLKNMRRAVLPNEAAIRLDPERA